MSRLYDRIVIETQRIIGEKPFFYGTPVILATNVADYVRGHYKSVKYSDIPNVAPPFEKFFIEFSSRVNPEEKEPCGVSFICHDFQKAVDDGSQDTLVPQVDGRDLKFSDIQEAKWACVARTHHDPEGRRGRRIGLGSGTEFRYFVLPNGEILSIDGHKLILSKLCGLFEEAAIAEKDNPNIATLNHLGDTLFFIALMTICFMHSKNVTLIDEIPPPKLSKRHEEKYGEPLVTYRTLNVRPMRTVKTADGGEKQEQAPATSALHICRGHFKDFRDGKGLFGKFKEIYWWDQHVRGDEKIGTVVKDYKVLTE